MKRNHDTPRHPIRTRHWQWASGTCPPNCLAVGLILAATTLSLSGMERVPSARAQAPSANGPRQPQRAPLRQETGPEAALPALQLDAGSLLAPLNLSHLSEQRLDATSLSQDLPDTFDWRDQNGTNYVTAVRDERSCAACYAFAFLGQMEARLLIDGAGRYDLSENHAKECNWSARSRFESPPGSPWGSCSGGNSFMLANLFSQTGTVLESCDPYVAGDVDCGASCPYQQTVLDWRLITAGPPPDPQVLKRYLYDHGPLNVSTFIDLDGGFHPDYDGSFTMDYRVAPERVNHTVLLVGWSDELPPVRGEITPAEGWILKNNWGPDWGDQGYFYASYGAANIGAFSNFVHEWQDYDPDGALWHYDEGGWRHSWGCKETTAWALAKFRSPEEANIERIEFWSTDATTDVDVFLYRDFDGDALSGLLSSRLDSHFGEAGYHSVRLDAPVRVAQGQEVVAVVRATNVSYGFPFGGDPDGKIEPGRTYLSCEGHWWHDMGDSYGTDLGIRLRTTAAESLASAPAPEVTSITPGSGSNDGILHVSRLAGANFQPGSRVKLTKAGEPDIQATSVVVDSDSRIVCDIDLAGVATGSWDVIVSNPGGRSGALDGGFAVATAEKRWNGRASTDWHTPENWSPAGVPSRVENVSIPATGNDPIISESDAAAQDLTIEAGAMLDLTTRDLRVEGKVTNDGKLKQTKTVTSDGTTPFLRLSNRAGDRAAYYGLDIEKAYGTEQSEGGEMPAPGEQAGSNLTDPAAHWYNGGQEDHEITFGGPGAADYGSSWQGPASEKSPYAPQPEASYPAPDTAQVQSKQDLGSKAGGPVVTVTISGNQQCNWRATGVRRCYEIRSSVPLRAAVRFFFREAERNGHRLDGLKAFRFGTQWAEVPGPHDRGALDPGEAQYVEVRGIEASSQFSLDRPSQWISTVYLPLAIHHWP